MKSYLSDVPQLITLLKEKGVLSEASVSRLLQALKQESTQEKPRFAGELAVDLQLQNEQTKKPLTHVEVKQALKEQSLRKIEACVNDMQAIIKGEHLGVPAWLTPQWGNGGVNQLTQTATIEDGISAAAVMAQNLMLLANASPAIASQAQPLVITLANIARGLANGDSARVPINTYGDSWIEQVSKEFQPLVEAANMPLKDNAGNAVDLDAYTQARLGDIEQAFAIQQQQAKDVNRSMNR